MRIGKIASSAECQMDEQFQNANFWNRTLIFQIEKYI